MTYASFRSDLLSMDCVISAFTSGVLLKAPATMGASCRASSGLISSPSLKPARNTWNVL